LGLAAGFMEPLESTSIHLVQSGMTRFLKVFPDKRFHPATTAAYNRETEHEYQLIRDFLVLHYKATQRDDTPFWRHCRAMAIPDSLAGKIEYFREYGHLLIEQADLFKEENWVQVLIGQGILPRVASPLSRSIDRRSLAAYMADLRNTYARTAAALPSHEAYLARMMQAVAAA
jgi:tryptophan halogenase